MKRSTKRPEALRPPPQESLTLSLVLQGLAWCWVRYHVLPRCLTPTWATQDPGAATVHPEKWKKGLRQRKDPGHRNPKHQAGTRLRIKWAHQHGSEDRAAPSTGWSPHRQALIPYSGLVRAQVAHTVFSQVLWSASSPTCAPQGKAQPLHWVIGKNTSSTAV